jgi:hypothetical protein
VVFVCRLYDPYADISTAMGGRRAAFQLPEGPEFVFQEEAAARRRGWTENLQFYTGVGYLGGVLEYNRIRCRVMLLVLPQVVGQA